MEEFFFFVVFIFSPAQFLIEEMVRQETSFCLFSIILSLSPFCEHFYYRWASGWFGFGQTENFVRIGIDSKLTGKTK